MKIHTLVFLLLCSVIAFSQSNIQCGEEAMLANMLRNDPQMLSRHQDIESRIYQQTVSGQIQHGSRSNSVLYVLPVVVHIIHNNGPENISDAQVIQAIQDLNEAYANTGYYDSTNGVNTQIQFCLAQRDPGGQPTTGITRNVSSLIDINMSTDDLTIKNMNRWNPNCYVNIWLVRKICTSNSPSSCNIGGYAYFPSSAGTSVDGIVCLSSYFGSSKANSVIHVHEMGHYLGLYHTFQGACTNNNCLTDGDRVCDTPPDNATASYACGAIVNTCTTDALSGFSSDQPDLYQDYMDYGNFHCMNTFTQGQKDRMLWTIPNVRSSLLGCSSCLNPCTNPSHAAFTASASNALIGDTIIFTNTSTNATTHTWYSNGTQVSTAANPHLAFTAAGTYIIKLQVANADPNCISYFYDTIIISCATTASFTQSLYTINPGQSVTFTSTSTGATSWQWVIDGVVVSTTSSFSHVFATNGDYQVYLIARGSSCTDTSGVLNFVHVGGTCAAHYTYTPANPTSCSSVTFVPDTNCHYANYFWSFCTPASLGAPTAVDYPTSAIGSNTPVGPFLFKDNNGNYHGFFCDYNNATDSTRYFHLYFGSSMANTPVTSRIHVSGITDIRSHSMSIMEDNGVYYAFLLTNVTLYRVRIGTNIMTNTWAATQVTGLTNAIGWGHDLQVVKSTNNYWALIANRNGWITVGFIGNNITNNISQFNSISSGDLSEGYFGLTYVKDKGNNYIFGCDFNNGLKRFDFGTSLGNNTPAVTRLHTFGNGLTHDLALISNCDGSYDGYLMKENNTDHKVLHLDSITGLPRVTASFPGTIPRVGGLSNFLITDVGVTALISEGYNFAISRLTYGSCNASNAYSLQKFPPPVSFTTPGSHYVHLVVDQGLPTESSYCNTINVTAVNTHLLDLGPDITLCYNGTHILKAGPWFANYQWSNGYTDSTITVYNGGMYSVTVTDFCGHVYTDSITISVDSNTVIALHDTIICKNGQAILHAPAGLNGYQWQPTATLSCPLCATTFASPAVTTVYTVQAKTPNGCEATGTETVTVTTCTGLEDAEGNIGLEYLRPNPARDKIEIGTMGEAGQVTVSLYNALGQQLMEYHTAFIHNNHNEFSLDISGLPVGLYMVELKHEKGGRVVTKLIKE
ncbi:MAG: hypothetical protein JWO03_345 [Bacteroidetes bacterium]|nr:hypothetical protein [Bacteroidota bacterium]